jgi:hypothetical protein
MKREIFRALAIAGFALTLSASVAIAQTTAAPPSAASPPPGGSPPVATPGAGSDTNAAAGARRQAIEEQIRATRQACRNEAKAQGLTGPAVTQHAQSCFAAKMPQAAKRIQCRREGAAKGLVQPALRDYVQQCLASKS